VIVYGSFILKGESGRQGCAAGKGHGARYRTIAG
jgi:hypothetical protein